MPHSKRHVTKVLLNSKQIKRNKMAQHKIENGFKAKPWSETKKGDVVYISGNLKKNIPTMVYGPHKIHDPEKQELESGTNRKVFREGWPCVFVLDVELAPMLMPQSPTMGLK
jgi:hypothetical protein